MKKTLLFLAVLLASVMPAMADYTLQFVESGSTNDSSNAYATNVSAVFTDASGVVEEVSAVSSVYPAKSGYGAKFGSSKTAGTLKFTLLQSTYVAAILKVAPYNATTSVTLRVNDDELPVTASADGGFAEITYSPGASFESMEITATTNTRFYLASITLVEQDTTGGNTTGGMGTTPSDCHVVSFPWEENFDAVQADGSSVLPCWDNSVYSDAAYTNPWTLTSGSALRSQCMRFDSYNASNGVVGELRSPDFLLTSNLALYIKYKNPSGGDFSIFVEVDTVKTLLASGLTNQEDWAFLSFDLSNYAGMPVRFVFRGTSNWGSGDAYVYLDRVAVMPVGSQMDTTNDPDYMPYISTFGSEQLHVDVVVGKQRTEFLTLYASGLTEFPTVTSSMPDVFNVAEVLFQTANYEEATSPGDIAYINVKYVLSSQELTEYEGTLSVVAGATSLELPVIVTTQPNYEVIPQDGTYEMESKGRALHLYTTPGQTVSYTLKYTYSGYTFDQVEAGFVQDWAPEGFSSSQAYQTGEGSGAFDLTFVSQTEGDYIADVRFEAHAGLCGSDTYESLTVYVHVTNSPMITGATEWNWGTVDYLCADTNYLTLQLLNMDTTAQITLSTYPSYKFMLGDYSISDGKLTIPAYLPSTLYAGTTEAELYVYLNGREVHKVSMKVDVRAPRITYLTPGIEFGTMRASDYPVWDTVYISVHDVDRRQLNFGWNVLPQDTADHRMGPFGVAPRVIINDTLVACPVVCNPAATVPGEYDGRIYYVCGMYWPEIPCHATILPSSKIEVSSDTIDFGVLTYSSPAELAERSLTITTQSLQEVTAHIGDDDAFALSSYTYKPAEGNYGLECRHQVSVYFEPREVGEHNGILYLVGDTGRLVVRNRVYLHATVVLPEPQFLPDTVIDFGTMNFYEQKTLGANIYMRYIDPKTTKMTSDDPYNMLTLGAPLRQYDTTNVDVMEYLPNYYPVTLKATRTGDIERTLTLTSADGAVLTRVKVRAHVLEPEMFFDELVHDLGYAEKGGAYREDTIAVHVRHCSATEVDFNTVSSTLDTTDESGFGTGRKIVLNDSTVLVPVGVNANFYTTMGAHYRNLRAICHEFTADLPLQVTIIPKAKIEVIPDTLDFGEVMYDAMVNAHTQLSLKVATTSLHQTVATIESDSVFMINQSTFGPTESYFGNRLEQDAVIYLDLNVPGEHYATLVLNGDSGKVVKRSSIHAYVAPRPVLYDTIRATVCDNESYSFAGEMIWNAGTYSETTKTIHGGDSVTTLILTVLPSHHGDVYATIRDYENYLFHGDTIREAGDFLYPLPGDASNGCDSTVTLHLTVLPTAYVTLDEAICANSAYTFYDEQLTEAGQYTHRVESKQIGDSVITLNLTVLPLAYKSVDASIYATYSYPFGGQMLTEAGVYYDTLVAANGCDSIVTLTLVVNPLPTFLDTLSASICQGEYYEFGGKRYSESGVYFDSLKTVLGGDSIRQLTLVVRPTSSKEINATIRDYETYTYQGDTLRKAGDYTYTLVAANGCDSVVTLHLTVLPTAYVTLDEAICANESYVFYGQGLGIGDEGTYTHRIENTQTGDSVITLNLTVHPVYNFEDRVSISASQTYTWHGRVFTEAGVYTDSLQSVYGCDSIWTLALTVLETRYDTATLSICEGDSVFFGDRYLFTSGTYEESYTTAEGRDSLSVLILDVKNRTYGEQQQVTIIEGESYLFGGRQLTEAGDYYDTIPNAAGCDSVLWVYVTVVPLCSEYVVVNAPEEVIYYTNADSIAAAAPSVMLVCPSHDAVIEWGVALNYNPETSGRTDLMRPVSYDLLLTTVAEDYMGDTLYSQFNTTSLDRTQYYYYRVLQCGEVGEYRYFHFEHEGYISFVQIESEMPKPGQSVIPTAQITSDNGVSATVNLSWYNVLDTLNPVTGNYTFGETYYAVVTTPMEEIFGSVYSLDKTTALSWNKEPMKGLVAGQFRSPKYKMEALTWSFEIDDLELRPDGQAAVHACAIPSSELSTEDTVSLAWQLSVDQQQWIEATAQLGYSVSFEGFCTDIHFPATLLRAGTYYIRVRANFAGETLFSREAEVVIRAGIVMAEEAAQQITITETGEEVATVQYSYDAEEEKGTLTLTNSTNEGSATTAVAITTNTVVEIVGTNTVVSEEAGFESSGDLEFVGRVDSTQVDEEGNTIYVALDSMSIESKKPIYAPGTGVTVTFNGIYMKLVVPGQEDANQIPSRSAARAQMKRAYRIAHAALESAGDESVISGFDEVDFINCGIIEPEGAEYDEENMELMVEGEPVYNCTIAPMETPVYVDPMGFGAVKDSVNTEKQFRDGILYIIRQDRIYTTMGQTVK